MYNLISYYKMNYIYASLVLTFACFSSRVNINFYIAFLSLSRASGLKPGYLQNLNTPSLAWYHCGIIRHRNMWLKVILVSIGNILRVEILVNLKSTHTVVFTYVPDRPQTVLDWHLPHSPVLLVLSLKLNLENKKILKYSIEKIAKHSSTLHKSRN